LQAPWQASTQAGPPSAAALVAAVGKSPPYCDSAHRTAASQRARARRAPAIAQAASGGAPVAGVVAGAVCGAVLLALASLAAFVLLRRRRRRLRGTGKGDKAAGLPTMAGGAPANGRPAPPDKDSAEGWQPAERRSPHLQVCSQTSLLFFQPTQPTLNFHPRCSLRLLSSAQHYIIFALQYRQPAEHRSCCLLMRHCRAASPSFWVALPVSA